MIFDYELMFVDDKDGTQQDIASGILGETLDLSGPGQGKGYRSRVALAFSSDTTANGDPEIQFWIETADNKDFTDGVLIPLMFPVPLKKADLHEGAVIASPLPVMGLQRYVRLEVETDSAITCMGLKAGFVLDAPEF